MSFINTSSTARPVVIGIDHGFGNIKTAHSCFKTGVTAYDQEPTFKSNLLVYDSRYYIIGDDHKEFTADKSQDQDYYILTLAAVAVELRFRASETLGLMVIRNKSTNHRQLTVSGCKQKSHLKSSKDADGVLLYSAG